MSKELDEIRARATASKQPRDDDSPMQPIEDRRTLLRLVDELRLQLQSERDENFTLNLTCAQLGEERDSLAADARRYRYWRQHQYQGLLDQDEYCDADSPQAVQFYRLTDAAMARSAKEAKHASPRGEER